MTRQVLLRSPILNRKQSPLSSGDQISTLKTTSLATAKTKENIYNSKKCGEVVGGTAAECAAVCCCCPFAVMNLLVLAVYKVPTGLCKKAWKKRKEQRMMRKRKGLLAGPTGSLSSRSGTTRTIDHVEADAAENSKDCGDGANNAVDMEKEMWERFYGTGFWRSPSQRDTCYL